MFRVVWQRDRPRSLGYIRRKDEAGYPGTCDRLQCRRTFAGDPRPLSGVPRVSTASRPPSPDWRTSPRSLLPPLAALCYSVKACPKGTIHVTTSNREVSTVKRTYQPHNTPRKRSMGFLERSSSASGRRILRNRRRKGRARLAV